MKKLKEVLAPMTGKERLEYLWTYYKWVLAVAVVAVVLLVYVVDLIIAKNTELVLGGATVNVELSQAGQDYLQAGVLEKFGTEGKLQEVSLEQVFLEDPKTGDPQTLQARQVWMAGQVMGQNMDYVLMDTVGKDFFITQGVFTDVTSVLTESQKTALEPYFVYSTATEDVPSYPIAIDVTHLNFFQENAQEKAIFLSFPGNTERTARVQALLDDLLAWGS